MTKARMTVIYKTPKDKDAFDKHYYQIHLPLARKLPGLRRYEVNDGSIISANGHSDIYLIANLYFDSLDAIKMAFASQQGKLCAEDRKKYAPDDSAVQIYLFETKEI
jgi:uncharacterized protein (TIGR02118 family)